MPLTAVCNICRQEFAWEEEDLAYFGKLGIAPYEQCSECFHRQRLSFRNERVFYKRKCDATGKDILALYHSDLPYKVYCAEYFWSDKWDAFSYGRDFDFNRTFFEQFAELKLAVPKLAIHNVKGENSDFCNTCVGNKNSYLVFGGDYNEDCMFGVLCDKNRHCMDIDYCYEGQYLYFCSDVIGSYECQFLFNSNNCSNCYFCEDLIGCNECILSLGLKNQSYCIANKRYSKEEYLNLKEQIMTGKYSSLSENFMKFLKMRGNRDVKYAHVVNCEGCSGDYIKDSKNCTQCFDVNNSQDCRDVIYASKVKDAFMCDSLGLNSEKIFNTLSTMDVFNVRSSNWIVDSSDVYYCDFCINSSNIFGCTGLNHGQYCVLNKKYSKEEYRDLVLRIVEHMKKMGEWGQFMPASMSCFAYNETTAGIYFPLEKEEALKRGFKWRDEEKVEGKAQTYEVPDDIVEVDEHICEEILKCGWCGKNFKILAKEFQWYQKQHVPVPRNCGDCRMKRRRELRNPRKLWDRECTRCQKPLGSTYAPERSEHIYCDTCYLAKVY